MLTMEALLVLIAASIFFLLVFQTSRRNSKRKPGNIPPGDMGWPIVGETLMFMKPSLSTTVGGFMEQHMARFGKIFVSNLFGKPIVVSAEPELNRFLFKNDTKMFEPGWPKSFLEIVGKSSISFLVGDAHKHMRSIIVEFLSTHRIRNLFLQDMEYMASFIMGSWKDGTAISSLDEATKFSFYIMVKNILSIGPEDPLIERLRKEYNTFIRGLVSFPLKIPGTRYWKGLKSRRNLLEILYQEIEERRRVGSDELRSKKDDLLDWVIKNTDYSLEKIGDMMLHTLFAAHDTSSRAICLMIYFLDDCPKAIAELKEEFAGVITSKQQSGGSKLTYEDYKSMNFTQSVISETLRLGNIVSHIQRKVSTDIHFKGFLIPKGYHFAAHFSAVHLDPELFEDPQRFDPWRWLRSSSGLKTRRSSEFMPFGGGARQCPGAEIARLEMAVFLHHLVGNYDWAVAEPDCPMTVPYVDFYKGLPIRIRSLTKQGQGGLTFD
ncbi:steroid (22S)-hydroxylase-like [Curcuma longa]|uniref:steroid (22S)-hydroxylase-like n=1 Tax=Curcuma longa TaxID=136217 RepID=UPI003D9F99E2